MPSAYAIGDIHGNVFILKAAYAKIREDAAAHGIKRPKVRLLGDYCDRGESTARVIDLILAARKEFDQEELAGNHDIWLNHFLRYGCRSRPHDEAAQWLANAPHTTLQSYGLPFYEREEVHANISGARKGLLERMPQTHQDFFNRLKLFHREGKVLFVHAGIDPNRTWRNQKDDHWPLTWNRGFDNSGVSMMAGCDPRKTHGFSIVHGHFKRAIPEENPGRLNIDTTGWKMNHLAVAKVDTATGKYELLPVYSPHFFAYLTKALTYRMQDPSCNAIEAYTMDRRWAANTPFRLHPYVMKLSREALTDKDPLVKEAAGEFMATVHAAQELHPEPTEPLIVR